MALSLSSRSAAASTLGSAPSGAMGCARGRSDKFRGGAVMKLGYGGPFVSVLRSANAAMYERFACSRRIQLFCAISTRYKICHAALPTEHSLAEIMSLLPMVSSLKHCHLRQQPPSSARPAYSAAGWIRIEAHD